MRDAMVVLALFISIALIRPLSDSTFGAIPVLKRKQSR